MRSKLRTHEDACKTTRVLVTSWRLGRLASAYSTAAIYLILAVAGLGLLLTAGQPLHVHESDTPALYNAECPFELAAHNGELNLPSPLPSAWVGLVEPFTPFVQFVAVVAPHSFHPAYRAPPLA
jgi:hypothetical protein